MIILDTNIVSELMKSEPNRQVLSWIDAQPSINLFITSITVAEICYGLRALPNGRKRQQLEAAFFNAISGAFDQRVLAFDIQAAHEYGQIMAERKALGRPMSILDGQIAAIAITHHYEIATRNTKDFDACGINVLNPFVD